MKPTEDGKRKVEHVRGNLMAIATAIQNNTAAIELAFSAQPDRADTAVSLSEDIFNLFDNVEGWVKEE